jgi:hypothetical protein
MFAMEQLPQHPSRARLTRHQIPTHLNVPDKIISFWGIGVTVRQLLVLLIGWSVAANVWVRLAWLTAPGPATGTLHLVLAALPAILALCVAFKQVAGRPLEVWALILLRYWWQPKVCIWRSVRGERAGAASRAGDRRSRSREGADVRAGETDLWAGGVHD